MNHNMLAIDTSNNETSVAIETRDGGSFYLHCSERAMQCKMLLPLIKNVMQEANVNFDDIDIIATSAGPGSFTGVRVSSSFVEAAAISKPMVKIVYIPSLYAIAVNSMEERPEGISVNNITALVHASRGQVYIQEFALDQWGVLAYNQNIDLISCADAVKYQEEHHENVNQNVNMCGSFLSPLQTINANVVKNATLYAVKHEVQFPREPIYVRPPV